MPTASLQPDAPTFSRLPALKNTPGKTRLVKDCLKTGKWYLGDSPGGEPLYWDVTPETLDTLERNFAEQMAAGYYHNLQWGHPAPIPGNSEQLVIEYISDLWREDDTLYFSVYVTPETAEQLQQKHRQVSVRVIPRFHPAEQYDWSDTLIHVAIVDHGAVPSQIPFRELSASLSASMSCRVENQRDFISLAALSDNSTSETNTVNQGTKLMDFAKLVELINLLLAKVSDTAKLPVEGENAVTEETLVSTLSMILEVLGINSGSTESTDDSSAATGTPADTGSAELSAVLTLIKSYDARLQAFESRDIAKRKADFTARAKELGACGLPAKNVNALLAQGEKNGWELSAFDAVEGLPGLKLGGQTKGFRNSEPDDSALEKARQKLGLPALKK